MNENFEQNIAIIIPARYGSKRFPGKPLALLQDKEVLAHVAERALEACQNFKSAQTYIATDDERILNFAKKINITALMTATDLQTGTDRVLAAAKQLQKKPDIIVNLQGDSPFVYGDMIAETINALLHDSQADIATPITQLSWARLDRLRAIKKETPFSGTTVIRNCDGSARWFSKQIIPALKNEKKIRGGDDDLSPVYRHIGLYAYTFSALEKFANLPPSFYEECEELEQLRALENNMRIITVPVNYKNRPAMTGIDSPEDLARAEALMKSMMGV